MSLEHPDSISASIDDYVSHLDESRISLVHYLSSLNCFTHELCAEEVRISDIADNIQKNIIVDFVDYNLSVISHDVSVNEDGSVNPPEEDPERPGYNFVKWDKDLTGITANMTMVAVYEPLTYKITYKTDYGYEQTESFKHSYKTGEYYKPDPLSDEIKIFNRWIPTHISVGTFDDIEFTAVWGQGKVTFNYSFNGISDDWF